MNTALATIARRGSRSAFTLVEVLLAVGIVAGLLVVVLFFYQQAAELRSELLADAERTSSARLVMERLTAELRSARTHTFYAVPLVGDTTYLQFITTALPSDSWTGERFGRISRPESDLKLVSYGAEVSPLDTNATGISRSEEPLVELRTAAPNEVSVSVTETNQSNSVLITDAFRFVRFRYWDGFAWTENWNDTFLPSGVEVTLGIEPLPPETVPDEYPYEVFRRVIHVPGGAGQEIDPFFEFPLEPAPKTAEVSR